MSEAIFGLVGVVVGALVSGAVEWWQAKQARDVAVRVANRLVQQELLTSAAAAEIALERESDREIAADLRDSLDRGLITNQAWQAHQETLAQGLPSDDWNKVASAYLGVGWMITGRDDDDATYADDVRSVAARIDAGHSAVVRHSKR